MQQKGAQGAHGGALLRELLNVGLQVQRKARVRLRNVRGSAVTEDSEKTRERFTAGTQGG